MKAKIGRNEACPCGSGMKYKKCCRTTSWNHSGVDESEWYKLRRLEGAVFDDHLIPYITKKLPGDVIGWAIEDYLPEDLPEGLDREQILSCFLIPFLLFNWIPDEDFGMSDFDPEMTLSQNYLKAHRQKLNSSEKHFIMEMNQTYYSFYCVLEVEVEKALIVKDILLGTTHVIRERAGTHRLKRGDIVFSRILTMNNLSIFVGMVPYIITADYHTDLIEFRDWLVTDNEDVDLSPEVLRGFSFDLVHYYFDIMITSFNNPLPQFVNTDNEPVQFSKSHFKISMSPEDVLNRLLPLTLSDDPEEFLHDAERDKSGELKRITISWLKQGNEKHKQWDNTIMGDIIIEKGKLVLLTNSENRTQQGKELLKKHLGEAIQFQQTLIESPEQVMRNSPKTFDKSSEETNLLESSEVQAHLKKMAKEHWENWFDEPIPALGNKTPREAATTKAGRERLEALFMHYERHDLEKGDDDPFKADVRYLRTELSLDKQLEG